MSFQGKTGIPAGIMAFPLYLTSYLPTAQPVSVSAATTTTTSAVRLTTTTSGTAANSQQQQQQQQQGGNNKTMDGAPVVPMDCYEDMFHEIAKKFYGDSALVQQGGDQQNGQQNNSQGELGLMDLDYQQVSQSRQNLNLVGNVLRNDVLLLR